jgi:hypothetical protein
MSDSCTRCRCALEKRPKAVVFSIALAGNVPLEDEIEFRDAAVAILCEVCASFVAAAIAGRPCFSQGTVRP